MAFSRNAPAGLISKTFQRIVTNSTATALNTTAQVATALYLSVETQNVRITFDASTPTANTGVLFLATNSPYYLEGVKCADVRIARATAGAIVNVAAFGRVGDK